MQLNLYLDLCPPPIPEVEITEVAELSESERGENGFGSTGNENVNSAVNTSETNEQAAADSQDVNTSGDIHENVEKTEVNA